MKYLIILVMLLAILAGVFGAYADVCIEQPPGEVICVPASPVGPGAVERVLLPVVRR